MAVSGRFASSGVAAFNRLMSVAMKNALPFAQMAAMQEMPSKDDQASATCALDTVQLALAMASNATNQGHDDRPIDALVAPSAKDAADRPSEWATVVTAMADDARRDDPAVAAQLGGVVLALYGFRAPPAQPAATATPSAPPMEYWHAYRDAAPLPDRERLVAHALRALRPPELLRLVAARIVMADIIIIAISPRPSTTAKDAARRATTLACACVTKP